MAEHGSVEGSKRVSEFVFPCSHTSFPTSFTCLGGIVTAWRVESYENLIAWLRHYFRQLGRRNHVYAI